MELIFIEGVTDSRQVGKNLESDFKHEGLNS